MSYTAVSPQEQEDKRKGAITSTVIHIALVILAMLPLLTFPDPPPGQAGVLVAFGEPDAGETGGAETPTAPPTTEVEPIAEEVKETPKKEEKKPTKPAEKPRPVKNPVKDVTTDKNSKERALAKEKARKEKAARDKAAREKAAAEAKARAEAKAKAEKEAAERAAAEAKRLEAEKWKNLGKVPGSGSGGGSGSNPGTQGQQNGDINGEALDGISTGSGVLGGGISGRKIRSKPSISDRSQSTGSVNVKVCVDGDGNVTSAKFTQAGSTATDQNLIRKAVAGAKKYKFDSSDRETQCGTIKINFRVQ